MSNAVEFEAFMSDMADPIPRWVVRHGDPGKFAVARPTIPVLWNGKVSASANGNIELGEAIDWVMRGLRAKKRRPTKIYVAPVDYMVIDYQDALATTAMVMAEL